MNAVPAVPPAPITPQTRVGDLLTSWPQSVEFLVQFGFAPLADAAHRERVKGLPVTLAMACANHGLDLDDLLRRLNAAVGGWAGAAGA